MQGSCSTYQGNQFFGRKESKVRIRMIHLVNEYIPMLLEGK